MNNSDIVFVISVQHGIGHLRQRGMRRKSYFIFFRKVETWDCNHKRKRFERITTDKSNVVALETLGSEYPVKRPSATGTINQGISFGVPMYQLAEIMSLSPCPQTTLTLPAGPWDVGVKSRLSISVSLSIMAITKLERCDTSGTSNPKRSLNDKRIAIARQNTNYCIGPRCPVVITACIIHTQTNIDFPALGAAYLIRGPGNHHIRHDTCTVYYYLDRYYEGKYQ